MKRFFIFLFSFILFFGSLNYAFGYEDAVRVLISDTNMKKFEHNDVNITSDCAYSVYVDDVFQFQSFAEEYTTISMTPAGFSLLNKGECHEYNRGVEISIKSELGCYLSMMGHLRKSKSSKYRGEFKIYSVDKNNFQIVNVLELEDYLKGVVPNEMPVRFGLEALKAQAVAARNYVKRPKEKKSHLFDVYDTVASQVYYGANTEDYLASQAVEETKGLYAIYDSELITALYHSTAGGHSEDFHNAFSDPKTGGFPASPIHYLQGRTYLKSRMRYDLTDEASVRDFYSQSLPTFDKESPYYRWSYSWSADELRDILNGTLKRYSSSPFIKTPLRVGNDIGAIKDINVLKRGVSGKAMYVRITTEKGNFYIAKELMIRKIFEYNSKYLPSANFFIDFEKDAYGDIKTITFTGGGYGHGVGMSQFGAGFLSKKGVTFDKILMFYYTDIAIGSKPFEVDLKDNIERTEKFYMPPTSEKRATLVIRNPHLVDSINIKINDSVIGLSDYYLSKKEIVLNIDNYIKEGENTFTVLPSNIYFSKKPAVIKLWVELFEGARVEE